MEVRGDGAGYLASQPERQMEWWYYCGHLRAGERRFGFHAAFFRRLTFEDRIAGSIPTEWMTPVVYYANFAMTDFEGRRFDYGHRRTFGGGAGAATDRFEVWLGSWRARGRQGEHEIEFDHGRSRLVLSLAAMKPAAVHGEGGFVQRVEGQSGYHYSFSRMRAEGWLRTEEGEHEVEGTAWMDREFGNLVFNDELGGWDWMGIQLGNGRELSVYVTRDPGGRATRHSKVSLIDEGGSVTVFGAEEFSLTAHGTWKSPRTGTRYPCGWALAVPALELTLRIDPSLRCQELDTRGTTEMIYWEGAAGVAGRWAGGEVEGRAYVELVGYHDSHRDIGLLEYVGRRARYWIRGGEESVCEEMEGGGEK